MAVRYIMIGGFLGAGKTSAMAALGRWLSLKGVRCGLITNDQALGLVDTQLLMQKGFEVEEIAGGCFCCRFDSLKQATDNLSKSIAPDVFLAEPVGSCTDLIATVSIPLEQLYGNTYSIAPLSVLIDPTRLQKRLGWKPGRPFSSKVRYIFDKQIEEADLLAINKIDAHSPQDIQRLEAELSRRWPLKKILSVSVQQEIGLEEWFEYLLESPRRHVKTMKLDYQLYAEGESELGWVNQELEIKCDGALDGNQWLLSFANHFLKATRDTQAVIAHCKMTLVNVENAQELAVVSMVDNNDPPQLRQTQHEPFVAGRLRINFRAQASPEVLDDCIQLAIDRVSSPIALARVLQQDSFRPKAPVPTHRMKQT